MIMLAWQKHRLETMGTNVVGTAGKVSGVVSEGWRDLRQRRSLNTQPTGRVICSFQAGGIHLAGRGQGGGKDL